MLIGAVVAASLLAAACSGHPTVGDGGRATVIGVVDGDTLDVDVTGRSARVRLIGVDTPELARPAAGDRPPLAGECHADEASRFTATLLPPGTAIRLERDIVGLDDYGRVLAYVYRAADDLFVNREIIRHGHGVVMTIEPNSTHREMFVDAARLAESSDSGLWARCR